MNTRREIIKNAALTATGKVLGAMASRKTATASTEQPIAQSTPLPESAKLLSGKVALVTGAARGIGKAIAVDYARNGADVALLDLADPTGGMAISGYRLANEQELDEAVSAVEAEGVEALKLKVDVRDYAAMKAAAEQTVRELGGLDIAVANAGICIWTTIESANEQQWRDVVDVTTSAFPCVLRRRGVARQY